MKKWMDATAIPSVRDLAIAVSTTIFGKDINWKRTMSISQWHKLTPNRSQTYELPHTVGRSTTELQETGESGIFSRVSCVIDNNFLIVQPSLKYAIISFHINYT